MPVSAGEKIAELEQRGFCVLRGQIAAASIDACRRAFWPRLLEYLQLHEEAPNRGPQRHFLPMPFEAPCFNPEFFFNAEVLRVVRGSMDERVVVDQWGCDVPLRGSEDQGVHVDYSRPLFSEAPELVLPPYMLVVSFGLVRITRADGPIEIAPGTHRLPREQALRAVQTGEIAIEAVPLEIGDVLIRHPWALHRGTPNTTDVPRAMVSLRFTRRWYADSSREVNAVPRAVWQSLTPDQQSMMRFPVQE